MLPTTAAGPALPRRGRGRRLPVHVSPRPVRTAAVRLRSPDTKVAATVEVVTALAKFLALVLFLLALSATPPPT